MHRRVFSIHESATDYENLEGDVGRRLDGHHVLPRLHDAYLDCRLQFPSENSNNRLRRVYFPEHIRYNHCTTDLVLLADY